MRPCVGRRTGVVGRSPFAVVCRKTYAGGGRGAPFAAVCRKDVRLPDVAQGPIGKEGMVGP